MVFNLFESMDDITQYITQSGLNFALAYTFREIYPIIPGIKYEMYKEGNKKWRSERRLKLTYTFNVVTFNKQTGAIYINWLLTFYRLITLHENIS